jgi:hypothetical protein
MYYHVQVGSGSGRIRTGIQYSPIYAINLYRHHVHVSFFLLFLLGDKRIRIRPGSGYESDGPDSGPDPQHW